jgi:hypothetical protein
MKVSIEVRITLRSGEIRLRASRMIGDAGDFAQAQRRDAAARAQQFERRGNQLMTLDLATSGCPLLGCDAGTFG